jgi:hypothetical protein
MVEIVKVLWYSSIIMTMFLSFHITLSFSNIMNVFKCRCVLFSLFGTLLHYANIFLPFCESLWALQLLLLQLCRSLSLELYIFWLHFVIGNVQVFVVGNWTYVGYLFVCKWWKMVKPLLLHVSHCSLSLCSRWHTPFSIFCFLGRQMWITIFLPQSTCKKNSMLFINVGLLIA